MIFYPRTVLCLSTAALLLSGCGQPQTSWPGGAPPQQAATESPMMAAPIEPVESAVMTDSVAVDRLASLESQVAGLRNDMNTVRPRLDALEGRFKQLSFNLDRSPQSLQPAKKAAAPAVKKKAPVAKPAPKATPPVTAEKKSTASAKVNRVRIGDQSGGKVRIVLDTSAPVKISHDIDNQEKILVIEVPKAGWGAETTRTLQNSPLIASYQAENDANGSRLIVQLKKEAEVAATAQVDPDKTGGYRSYLDLRGK